MTKYIQTARSRETLVAANIAYAKLRALVDKEWEDLHALTKLHIEEGIRASLDDKEYAQVQSAYMEEYNRLKGLTP